jgi:hypothetical protein
VITSIIISDNDERRHQPRASNLGCRHAADRGCVPKPSAGAMMIGRFGLAGGMLRRRRTARA